MQIRIHVSNFSSKGWKMWISVKNR